MSRKDKSHDPIPQVQRAVMAQSTGVVGFLARRLFGTQPVEEETDEEEFNEGK